MKKRSDGSDENAGDKNTSEKNIGISACGGDLALQRNAIAERLRSARELAGLSQAQAARLLGLHRPAISESEAGRRRVAAEELARFAEVYGVSLAWLGGSSTNKATSVEPRVELAARELSKLRPEDLDKVVSLLTALRGSAGRRG